MRPRFFLTLGVWVQDNFVSHTMKVDEQANLDRINEQKRKSDVTNPLEPLIVNLLKGFLDDADLSAKLQRLYRVSMLLSLLFTRTTTSNNKSTSKQSG